MCQIGEGEAEKWGPAQDAFSHNVMQQLIAHESPDLVVFSGDQLTGNNINENATAYWMKTPFPQLSLSFPSLILNPSLPFPLAYLGAVDSANGRYSWYLVNLEPRKRGSRGSGGYGSRYPKSQQQFFGDREHGIADMPPCF